MIVRGIEQNPPRIAGMLLGLKPNTVSVKYGRCLKRLKERLPESVFHYYPDENDEGE